MAGTFSEWTDRLKVYNDYVRALAEYKKVAGENLIREAEAAGKWQKVKAMQVVVRQLELAMRGLNAEAHRNRRQIAFITRKEKTAEHLLSGRRISTFATAWSGVEFFLRKALVEPAGDALFEIPISTRARAGSNFINNSNPQLPCDSVPDDLENVLELADWMKTKRYMARTGKPAQRDFRKLMQAMNKVAGNTVKTLRKYLDQIRRNTYKAWQPVSIIGVETSATAMKIQETGQETA